MITETFISQKLLNFPENKLKEEKERIMVQTATVLIISIVIASVSVLLAMYVYKVGFFHSSVSAFN